MWTTIFRYRCFSYFFSFILVPFPYFSERSALVSWRRSNTFSVPSNGVEVLSDAAVEVLIHVLLPHACLFRLACSCIPSTCSLPRSLSCIPCNLIFCPHPLRHVTTPFFLLHDTHTHVARSDSDDHVRYEFRECIYYLSSLRGGI